MGRTAGRHAPAFVSVALVVLVVLVVLIVIVILAGSMSKEDGAVKKQVGVTVPKNCKLQCAVETSRCSRARAREREREREMSASDG